MSIREVTYYFIQCDHPDCTYKTGDTNSDYSAWSDRDGAETDWEYADLQSTADGKHYCDAHRKPECADCDRTEGLIHDAEESGEWWCPEHRETAPEYEAPSGVVL